MKELPLSGRRIVVTRPKGQAESLLALIRREGGEALEIPALEIRDLDDLAPFRAVVERLSGAARELFNWLREQGGSVSAAAMNKRAPARNQVYGGYSSLASFWRPVPRGETVQPLAELVCTMLVVPVMPYP